MGGPCAYAHFAHSQGHYWLNFMLNLEESKNAKFCRGLQISGLKLFIFCSVTWPKVARKKTKKNKTTDYLANFFLEMIYII